MYKEIYGDLIALATDGVFDVITHGCNCFCAMGAGIAPQMDLAFGCNHYQYEHDEFKGDINKLGQIAYGSTYIKPGEIPRAYLVDKTNKLWESEGWQKIIIVNSYTQYHYGKNHADGVEKPLDYEALTLCLRKINKKFSGKHIGLPQIGAGLAGGDWNRIKQIIQKELKDCYVTVVIYDKK